MSQRIGSENWDLMTRHNSPNPADTTHTEAAAAAAAAEAAAAG